jgi:hypothetical protein
MIEPGRMLLLRVLSSREGCLCAKHAGPCAGQTCKLIGLQELRMVTHLCCHEAVLAVAQLYRAAQVDATQSCACRTTIALIFGGNTST